MLTAGESKEGRGYLLVNDANRSLSAGAREGKPWLRLVALADNEVSPSCCLLILTLKGRL